VADPAWQQRLYWRLGVDGTLEKLSDPSLAAGAASTEGSIVDGVA